LKTFDSLGLAPALLTAVRACGYEMPTPIQSQAIPRLLEGRDLMGCAQTGTGKTAAFALPIINQLHPEGTRPIPRALVLVPTRELAMQVADNVKSYGSSIGIRCAAVYGGVPLPPQEMVLKHGVDILVATPGRLKDLLWRGAIDFAAVRFLVLDEADRMLDMGFIDDVREIIGYLPVERQTMLFSATLEPEILRLARDILRDPIRVEVAPPATVADGVEHVMVSVASQGKRSALETILRQHDMEKTLIFTRTRRGAHQLTGHLRKMGLRAASIHSDKSQSERTAALRAFGAGRVDVLVATDIAARGLDVRDISHVVNYDLPYRAEDYVHRIGRTARAGSRGVAISLVTPADQPGLKSIERLIGMRIEWGTTADIHQGRDERREADGGRGMAASLAAASDAPAPARVARNGNGRRSNGSRAATGSRLSDSRSNGPRAVDPSQSDNSRSSATPAARASTGYRSQRTSSNGSGHDGVRSQDSRSDRPARRGSGPSSNGSRGQSGSRGQNTPRQAGRADESGARSARDGQARRRSETRREVTNERTARVARSPRDARDDRGGSQRSRAARTNARETTRTRETPGATSSRGPNAGLSRLISWLRPTRGTTPA